MGWFVGCRDDMGLEKCDSHWWNRIVWCRLFSLRRKVNHVFYSNSNRVMMLYVCRNYAQLCVCILSVVKHWDQVCWALCKRTDKEREPLKMMCTYCTHSQACCHSSTQDDLCQQSSQKWKTTTVTAPKPPQDNSVICQRRCFFFLSSTGHWQPQILAALMCPLSQVLLILFGKLTHECHLVTET